MIILDKKSYALLEYLIQLDRAETVMQIARQLNQSRRKIYYHLEKINDALPSDCDPIISYSRVGIVLNDHQKAVCQELLEELSDYAYVMNVEERQQLLLTYIAISQDKVTIEKMMQLSDVSRNTILNDLRTIREGLEQLPYRLSLQVTKSRGYYLECNPLVKVQWLYKLFKDIETNGNAHFQVFMDKQLSKIVAIEQYISTTVLLYLKAYFVTLQENLGKKLNQQEYQFLLYSLPYVLLSYRNRMVSPFDEHQLNQDFAAIRIRKEYTVVQQLASVLEERFSFVLEEAEVGLIAMLLLSFRKDEDNHLNSRDYVAMRLTLQEFIARLEEEFQLSFISSDSLCDQLLTHCKALLYRKAYGIFLDNPLTEDIQNQYSSLFEKTRICASILEEAWSITLTDDEIAYLTIHVGGSIRMVEKENQIRQTILVCDEGVAVQNLLHHQCRQYLTHIAIVGVYTQERYEQEKDHLTIDFIITTLQELQTDVPTIVVEPILKEGDIMRLLHIDRGGKMDDFQVFSQHLKQLIPNYIKDATECRKLRKAIEKTVYQDLWLQHEEEE